MNEKKLCFVVGPIGDAESETRIHADWLLEEIVEPVFDELGGYSVVRADKISSPGMIDAQVIKHLIDAEVVVADLSALNPNAFYEIGIRHMLQKPIIHMQLAEDEIPFDISLYRAIKFSRTRPSDIKRARQDLKTSVQALTAAGYKVDNPITRARGQISLELQATPSEQVILDQMKAIQSRLRSLESRYLDATEISNYDKRFVRNALTVMHEPMNIKSEKSLTFRGRLRKIFGTRMGRATFTSTEFTADLDTSGAFEDLERWETEVTALPGVREVSIIPF